ncbi:MAG TPA: hypothetical protein VN764_08640, partial [Polyangiaceae bacterium]|nr:hypothetical protein [Polyangiaceae bacterium]
RKDEAIENRGAAATPDGRGFDKKRPGGGHFKGGAQQRDGSQRRDGRPDAARPDGGGRSDASGRGPGGDKLTHNPFADLFRR